MKTSSETRIAIGLKASNNVVSLGKESVPVVKNLFLLIGELREIGYTVFWL